MRAGAFFSVVLAVGTAGGAVALAVVSTVCSSCGNLPDPATPAPLTPSASASPTGGPGGRLSRALLTGFGSARVTETAHTGTYAALAGVPIPDGVAHDALTGRASVVPAGCGVWPASGWTRTARPAPAAAATLTVARAGGATRMREVLFAPAHRPAGLTLPVRCRAFTLPGGIPARAKALPVTGVGDVARGVVTLVGRRGAADRVALYTIVFRVGHVYGVVGVGGTGRAPGGAAVRRMAYDYARRAATRTRGLT